MSQEILIVDDEIDICRLVSETLEDENYHTRYALEATQALEEIKRRCPGLIILDIWLGDSRFDGIKLLEMIRKDHPQVPIIMMSGHGTIETAVQAIKMGAYDFIEKPFKIDRLLFAVSRAMENIKLRRENTDLKSKTMEVIDLTGKSASVQHLKQLITRIAPTNSRVLISGKSGTGKESIARLIHQRSLRKGGPFVVLNCANLEPEHFETTLFGVEEGEGQKSGLFEQAHHGTLLLDEVTDMPLETQSKMVRSLQEQTFLRVGGKRKVDVDVRVLATTNRDIKQAVEQGCFREDLYYRLNVVPLTMPALQHRREDIPDLIQEMAAYSTQANGLVARPFSAEAIRLLQSYSWPGNIRQLKNIIEWILIMAAEDPEREIQEYHLPTEIKSTSPSFAFTTPQKSSTVMELSLKEARENFEKDYLLAQIARFEGNISQTAQFIGMERSALHRKLKSLNINREEG